MKIIIAVKEWYYNVIFCNTYNKNWSFYTICSLKCGHIASRAVNVKLRNNSNNSRHVKQAKNKYKESECDSPKPKKNVPFQTEKCHVLSHYTWDIDTWKKTNNYLHVYFSEIILFFFWELSKSLSLSLCLMLL